MSDQTNNSYGDKTFDTVDLLKYRLLQVYKQYGRLHHPEVVKVSQMLDQALNELDSSLIKKI